MIKQHGPWKINSSKLEYQNEYLQLVVDKVTQPDGKEGSYTTVKVIEGVAVLAIDEDDNVYLTKQFRYAIGEESLEVISGGMEEGESSLTAAKRETKEEAGIEAAEWTAMGLLNLDTSLVKSPVHMFIARKLKLREKEEDNTEEIKLVKVSLEEAVQLVMDNQITHSHSTTLILKAALLSKDL